MRPLSRFIVRAPLLPLSSLKRPARDALSHPLAVQALAHLPPDADRARENYARRAAFRPTPHGLWAGVLMGSLGKRTRVATGNPLAHLTLSYAQKWARARALLDAPSSRESSRLRVAPSLSLDAAQASWLAFGEDGSAQAEARVAELDEPLARVIESAQDWRSWPEVRGDGGVDDEWLLQLVDDGLLVSSLEPLLVGPAEPTDDPEGAHAVLSFDGVAVLPRAAVERAARLAPLLHRLQQALSPPVAERELARPAALDAVSEVFGAGALDLAALGRGEYGVLVDDEPIATPSHAVPAPLLSLLVERLAAGDCDFSFGELDQVTPSSPPPPTCELFLQPTKNARGDGWLVGLHAPAGASWGRFAHALGQPLMDALDELAEAERQARPGEERLDVSFAPTRALADLAAHPPIRRAALALMGWPENAVPPTALELLADGAALEPLALRAGDTPIFPSPLHRLRSTTAPPGVHRLLAGWALHRQHAPWAFGWGPLADLPRLLRVTIDGLVVAPASWRVPSLKSAGELRRWRRLAEVPRFVQVGHEDELMYLDLDGKNAHAQLAKLSGRAWEIWPPLDQTPDADGRRLEAVVALVDDQPSEATRAAISATATAGKVEPPAVDGPAPGWLSYRLFGAPDRADGVLVGVVRGLVDEARRAGELEQWFYLRYVDAPGRPHLRLRLLPVEGKAAALDARLSGRLTAARASSDVVAVERGEYFREWARYGRDAMLVVERAFEVDSDLALALLEGAGEDGGDAVTGDVAERIVLALDTLASSLDVTARRALAARRRRAHEHELTEDLAPEYRARQRRLTELLAHPPLPVAQARSKLPPLDEQQLPALLHLCVVRHDPSAEARAYYFWERALDSLSHRRLL